MSKKNPNQSKEELLFEIVAEQNKLLRLKGENPSDEKAKMQLDNNCNRSQKRIESLKKLLRSYTDPFDENNIFSNSEVNDTETFSTETQQIELEIKKTHLKKLLLELKKDETPVLRERVRFWGMLLGGSLLLLLLPFSVYAYYIGYTGFIAPMMAIITIIGGLFVKSIIVKINNFITKVEG